MILHMLHVLLQYRIMYVSRSLIHSAISNKTFATSWFSFFTATANIANEPYDKTEAKFTSAFLKSSNNNHFKHSVFLPRSAERSKK